MIISFGASATGLLAGALFCSMSALAAPGVALTMDVTQAMDDRGNVGHLQAHTTAHVTLLHLDGDHSPLPS